MPDFTLRSADPAPDLETGDGRAVPGAGGMARGRGSTEGVCPIGHGPVTLRDNGPEPKLKGTIEMMAAICGKSLVDTGLKPSRIGCGNPIMTCVEVYRCTDCQTPFHRICAKRHFGLHGASSDFRVPLRRFGEEIGMSTDQDRLVET